MLYVVQTYLTAKAARELKSVVMQLPPREALVDLYYPGMEIHLESRQLRAMYFTNNLC